MKMQNKHPDYMIYVTLLDAYNWYASSESDDAEHDLINKINRVRFESEAAAKGTWFNNLVDLCISGSEKFSLNYVTSPVSDIVEKLNGAVNQVYVSTHITIDGKTVELYGYADYLKEDTVIDLKTTSQYELGKYKDSMQRHLYPIALTDNGNEISQFEFLVCDFKQVFSETYQFNYSISKSILVNKTKEFIRFIESKRELITDKKVFGYTV